MTSSLVTSVGPTSHDGPVEALHLLNRTSFGPGPADLDRLLSKGSRVYLREQLGAALPDQQCEARLDPYHLSRESTLDLVLYCHSGPNYDELYERMLLHLRAARLLRAVYSRNQLREVMVDFWYNHFNVYAYPWAQSLPAYEREAIRPHVFGRFRDLLGAVASHPAMMYYLDNYLNRANSVAGGKVVRGVNENYGRELLELHTVGVDAGYTQADVYDAARVFTGWGIAGWAMGPPEASYLFGFMDTRHDRERKNVFGIELGCDGLEDDGQRLLDHLARHPKTARFISRKLVQRFVADDPPPALVERCASVFMKEDGSIPAVLSTIFGSEEFLSPQFRRAKIKTPFEFVVSAVRAGAGEVRDPEPMAQAIADMGMPLYECKPPTGYSNRSTDFVNPAAQIRRFDFALRFAGGAIEGVRPTAVVDADLEGFIQRIERDVVGEPLSQRTVEALRQAPAEARGQKQLALLFASPEFQRK
jgi:uncharacterized protein (DUF1800 family)